MTFNPLASTYDQDFTLSPIAQYLRDRVHTRLNHHFNAGDSVLELGCGTGEDALRLARRGVRVLATDASDEMLRLTREKCANQPEITTCKLDISKINAESAEIERNAEEFDGVYANFGVLNCIDDWHPLGVWLAARIRRGGTAGFGVMSPFCLWEMAWHGLHGEFDVAFRRLRKSARFDVGGGEIAIHYPTIRRLTLDFAPHFRRVHVEPLGVLLPPSDVYRVIERRPRLMRRLIDAEERIGRWRIMALYADHYWIEFERQ